MPYGKYLVYIYIYDTVVELGWDVGCGPATPCPTVRYTTPNTYCQTVVYLLNLRKMAWLPYLVYQFIVQSYYTLSSWLVYKTTTLSLIVQFSILLQIYAFLAVLELTWYIKLLANSNSTLYNHNIDTCILISKLKNTLKLVNVTLLAV